MLISKSKSAKYLRGVTLLFFVLSLFIRLDAALEIRSGKAANLNDDLIQIDGKLDGIQGIPSPKRIQFLPYSVAKGAFSPALEGNPFRTGSLYSANMGLNIKYGLTSNLTLDGTFNPDFGQVETDPAQINLTAFETYFPEKRPFFVEGKSLLNFSLGIDIIVGLFDLTRFL